MARDVNVDDDDDDDDAALWSWTEL